MIAECHGCHRQGAIDFNVATSYGKPAWCVCHGTAGPYTAPPGTVVMFSYMAPEQTEDLARARAITNEYIHARDAGSDARWTPAGKVRDKSTKIYRDWAKRMDRAIRALNQLQRDCDHIGASLFSSYHCYRCAAVLPIRRAG